MTLEGARMEAHSNKWKIITALRAVALACAACWFFLLRPDIRFSGEDRVLERGVEYRAVDFVTGSRGEVTPEREMLDTLDVGEHSFRYTVKNYIFKRDITYYYDVIDTVPPHIEIGSMSYVMDPGAPFTDADFRANVSVDEGTVEYETDYDPTVSGTYTVVIRAVDDYGNSSSSSYELVVKDTQKPTYSGPVTAQR